MLLLIFFKEVKFLRHLKWSSGVWCCRSDSWSVLSDCGLCERVCDDTSRFVQCLSGVNESLELTEAVCVETREKKIFLLKNTPFIYRCHLEQTNAHSERNSTTVDCRDERIIKMSVTEIIKRSNESQLLGMVAYLEGCFVS